jgi:NADPH-dependent ferric siderophore reductase
MTNEAGAPGAARQEGAAGAQQAPAGRPARRQWPLTVTDVIDLTPHMRRIEFTGDELEAFEYKPGQDVVVYFPTEENPNRRRHYTVSRFDPDRKRLCIDFLRHGDGPGALFAEEARPGMEVMLSGPVTRHEIDPDADWYLFAGDETALPAIASLVETLPSTARALAYIEVSGPQERQPLSSQAALESEWLYRGQTPGQESDLLHRAIAGRDLPPGRGDVFLAGETGRMRELRKSLLERGLGKDQIFAMGYWRPGRFGGDETIRD